jgi:hypothetical protein
VKTGSSLHPVLASSTEQGARKSKTLAYPLMFVVPIFGCAMAYLTTNHQMHYCHERLRHFTSKPKSMYRTE